MSNYTYCSWRFEPSEMGICAAIVAESLSESLVVCDFADDPKLEDALLMAAAPDLFEALQNALELIDVISPFECNVTRKARAAIAKAMGEVK